MGAQVDGHCDGRRAEIERVRLVAADEMIVAQAGDEGVVAYSGCITGWVPTLDALVALDRDQPDLAVELLSADIDGPDPWEGFVSALWRPWYAALWAEAAVLTNHPDAATRLQRSVAATSENPIATTIVHRASDLAHGIYDNLPAHARTFGALGCVYQQRRTETLLERQG